MSQSEYREPTGHLLHDDGELMTFWQRLGQRTGRISPWFWGMVIIPAAIAGLYLFVISSDLYMSEARFVVHSPGRENSQNLSAMVHGAGMRTPSNGAYTVESFITSRDAVQALDQHNDLRGVLSRPEADFIGRFPNPIFGNSFESLFQHYQHFIDVTVDATTGVATLQVLAYRADDAQAIAKALLGYSEALVNKMNAAAEEDAVRTARQEVENAQKRLAAVQQQLTAYRLQQQILDPQLSSTSIYGTLSGLTTARAAAATQLAETLRNAPDSPILPGLRARLSALDGEVAAAMRNVTGTGGSVANKLGEYQRLSLEQELAVKLVASAVQTLQTARLDAQKKHSYIEHISEPNHPDYALYPRRLLYFGIVLVVCLLIYGIAWLLVASVREHGSA